MRIDSKESRNLALSLSIQMNAHGIDLDTDKFCTMLLEDNSVENILHFCSAVLYPEIAMKYDINKKELQSKRLVDDEGHENSTDKSPSEQFSDVLAQVPAMSEDELRQEIDNARMFIENKLRMVTVSEKYCGGSVEVARGKRMSIASVSEKSIRLCRLLYIKEEACNQCIEAMNTMNEKILLQNVENEANFWGKSPEH